MPVISISMNDEDVMSRVGRLFGRTVFKGRVRDERWQPTYQLRLTGAPAVAWMHALRPLLGIRRQAQIDRALASYDPRPKAILTDETATLALAALRSGESVRTVAERFAVSAWCIYDLRLGRTFKHLITTPEQRRSSHDPSPGDRPVALPAPRGRASGDRLAG